MKLKRKVVLYFEVLINLKIINVKPENIAKNNVIIQRMITRKNYQLVHSCLGKQ